MIAGGWGLVVALEMTPDDVGSMAFPYAHISGLIDEARLPQRVRDRAHAVFAAMDGRFSVAIDDIKKAAIPVLRHRISTNFQAQAEGKSSDSLMGGPRDGTSPRCAVRDGSGCATGARLERCQAPPHPMRR